MSWVRVWIHMVFSTKSRYPFLKTTEIRETLFQHIRENAKKKEIYLKSIGGYTDHVHCLISLNKELSISKTAQLIKGESSSWINKEKLIQKHFNWQDDFWAVGVSESHVEAVINYINNQEEHHKLKKFSEEVDKFMKKYGWEIIKGK